VSARVPLEFVNETMRLAHPISDAEGRLVAGVGSAVTATVVRALRRLAIQTVLVVDNEEVASWERAQALDERLRELERRLDREPTNRAYADAIEDAGTGVADSVQVVAAIVPEHPAPIAACAPVATL